MCVFSNSCVPDHLTEIKFFYNRDSAVFQPSEALRLQISDLIEAVPHPTIHLDCNIPRKIKSVLYTVFSEYVEAVPNIIAIKNHDVLSNVIMYVREHYLERITLSSVAKELGYNPKYLSQCLGVIPNMTFPSLVSSLRVDHAKHLLVSTDKKIIDVAYDCGFENEQSFHRTFLKYARTTPGKYRTDRKKV